MKLSDSNENSIIFSPGDIIADTYKISRHLRNSGMGQLYLCRCIKNNNQLVVMKILDTPKLAPSLAKRFRNEIAASYKIDHTNVVHIYEYINTDKFIAYTMEYVEGGDLADLIENGHPLKMDLILNILSQICSGIAAIHEANIIHRDLKPENVLIDEHSNIKISDFGVAWSGATLGKKGGIVGTIEYLSPEYLRDGTFDKSSDIYALGVMAYELITGQRPFHGSGLYEHMRLKISTDPVAPHKLRPSCPIELSDIILKALARASTERYSDANQIRKDLRKLIDSISRSPATPNKRKSLSDSSKQHTSKNGLNGTSKLEPKKTAPNNDTSFVSDSSLKRQRASTLKSPISRKRKTRLERHAQTAGVIAIIACAVIIIGRETKTIIESKHRIDNIALKAPLRIEPKAEKKEGVPTQPKATSKPVISATLAKTTVSPEPHTFSEIITPEDDASKETYTKLISRSSMLKSKLEETEPPHETQVIPDFKPEQEILPLPEVNIASTKAHSSLPTKGKTKTIKVVKTKPVVVKTAEKPKPVVVKKIVPTQKSIELVARKPLATVDNEPKVDKSITSLAQPAEQEVVSLNFDTEFKTTTNVPSKDVSNSVPEEKQDSITTIQTNTKWYIEIPAGKHIRAAITTIEDLSSIGGAKAKLHTKRIRAVKRFYVIVGPFASKSAAKEYQIEADINGATITSVASSTK